MLVERHRAEAVQVLRLNRPEARNALNPALLDELGVALDAALDDAGVRAIVLTGAGDKAFCAGMDLAAFADDREHRGDSTTALTAFFAGEYAKPIIAAVNGAAVGGGFELVLTCDLVVAVRGARFGLPEVKRGLFAAGGGTALSARIPLPVALEMGLTGDYVDAERAARLGLVNRVVEGLDELLPEALVLASTVAANGPLGVQMTKRLMRRAVAAPAARATGEEMGLVFGSQDAQEGAAAFLEKRPPVWTGR